MGEERRGEKRSTREISIFCYVIESEVDGMRREKEEKKIVGYIDNRRSPITNLDQEVMHIILCTHLCAFPEKGFAQKRNRAALAEIPQPT